MREAKIIFVIDIGNRGDIYMIMSNISAKAARLMDCLPETDKLFAYEFIKKLVLARDPDFTKTTAEEKKKIENAEKSGYLDDDEIDWENIGTE